MHEHMHNGTHLQFHVKALIVSGFHPVALTVFFMKLFIKWEEIL
jgi:hypothetical protein